MHWQVNICYDYIVVICTQEYVKQADMFTLHIMFTKNYFKHTKPGTCSKNAHVNTSRLCTCVTFSSVVISVSTQNFACKVEYKPSCRLSFCAYLIF